MNKTYVSMSEDGEKHTGKVVGIFDTDKPYRIIWSDATNVTDRDIKRWRKEHPSPPSRTEVTAFEKAVESIKSKKETKPKSPTAGGEDAERKKMIFFHQQANDSRRQDRLEDEGDGGGGQAGRLRGGHPVVRQVFESLLQAPRPPAADSAEHLLLRRRQDRLLKERQEEQSARSLRRDAQANRGGDLLSLILI